MGAWLGRGVGEGRPDIGADPEEGKIGVCWGRGDEERRQTLLSCLFC